MKLHAATARRARHLGIVQGGFTLVELMVAMVLGMLLVIALGSLLISVNRNSSEMSKDNAVIENGRFAAQLLQADLSHSGFWGGYVPRFDDLTYDSIPTGALSFSFNDSLPTGTVTVSSLPSAVPDACLAFASWSHQHVANLMAIPVQVYPVGAAMPCSTLITSPQANTDVVIVRHLAPCVATAGGAEHECKDIANDLYFQVQRCLTVGPGFADVPFAFGTSGLTMRKRDCTATVAGTLADKYKFVSNIYYIRSYSTTAGDAIPTLMRLQFKCTLDSLGTSCTSAPTFQSAEALIEGVERLRVELGLDTVSDSGATLVVADGSALNPPSFESTLAWANPANRTSATNRGDGLPDGQPVHCTSGVPCTNWQLMNTVSVKLYLLMRSPLKTAGYTDAKTYRVGSAGLADAEDYSPNDNYKRHMFMQTVRLTNISMRRETP
jgi:type IV pilus assembly protein PilW